MYFEEWKRNGDPPPTLQTPDFWVKHMWPQFYTSKKGSTATFLGKEMLNVEKG